MDREEETEEIKIVLRCVPQEYHDFLDVFLKVNADKLPERWACDHHIKLDRPVPPVGPIYSLSIAERDELQAYIQEMLSKGFIRPSSSSTGAPVLFTKKKYGGLCLCVDYGRLNAVAYKNSYSVPPMSHLLVVFSGAKFFSKIDLRGAYNLL